MGRLEYGSLGRFTPGVKNFSWKAWSGSCDPFKKFKPLQYFCSGWSYTLNLASGSFTANFPWKGRGLGYLTLFKISNTSIFLQWIKLHSSNLTSGSISASPIPGVKNFSPKTAWFGSPDRFGDKATSLSTLFKFHKCIDYGEWHTIPPPKRVVSVTWPLFEFNPFNVFGRMRWGSGGKRGRSGYHALQDSWSIFKQVCRRRYESRRSSKPKLH